MPTRKGGDSCAAPCLHELASGLLSGTPPAPTSVPTAARLIHLPALRPGVSAVASGGVTFLGTVWSEPAGVGETCAPAPAPPPAHSPWPPPHPTSPQCQPPGTASLKPGVVFSPLLGPSGSQNSCLDKSATRYMPKLDVSTPSSLHTQIRFPQALAAVLPTHVTNGFRSW